jgi:hypothetical protein
MDDQLQMADVLIVNPAIALLPLISSLPSPI